MAHSDLKLPPPPPESGTVTINARVFRCVTRSGFVAEFWAVLRAWQEACPDVRQEDVFDYLNEEYKSAFGAYAFNSFGAFRKYRDRDYKK